MALVIEAPRVRLRGWTDADIEAWAAMNADPRVMEFFVEPTPLERSREQAAQMRDDLEENGYGWFVLERKDQPGFAGVVAIDDIRYEMPFKPLREIGWRLPVEQWGHGFASEGATVAMRYAFGTLKWPHLIAMTAAINERSKRVMRRLRMTHDYNDDFEHPRVPDGHALKHHALYRRSSPDAKDCPNCGGTNVIPIMYGVPDAQMSEENDRGAVALGGAIVFPDNPRRQCKDCDQAF